MDFRMIKGVSFENTPYIIINNLFLKLDRKNQNGGLWDTGIDIFREVILTKKIKHATISGLMKLIDAERRGELVTII